MDPEYVFNKALPYLTGKLEDAGLTVQIGFNKTERTMFLLLNDSVKCGINQLINELLDAEPDAHHDLMDPWVPYLIERTRIGETIPTSYVDSYAPSSALPTLSHTRSFLTPANTPAASR